MILIAAASGEGSLQTLLKCLKELEDLFKQDPAEAPLVPPRNDCVIRCEKGGHAAAETWAGMTEEEAQLARHPPEAVPGPEEPLPPVREPWLGTGARGQRGPARGRGSTAAGRAPQLCGAAMPGARRVGSASLKGPGAGAPPSPKNEGKVPASVDPPRHGRGSNP
ncbi:uncharacterized protein LOC143695334 isoform X1 [Agelaius phoeniceus]|uniref:uncharacterized protein LOC143695334 isoform X1 n=1 Tax=Agelaius phoeniceus TaxID=39638 RepID=UPI004055340F